MSLELPPLTPAPAKNAILAAQKKVIRTKAKHKILEHSHWFPIYLKLYSYWAIHYNDYFKHLYTNNAIDAFEKWCKTQEGESNAV